MHDQTTAPETLQVAVLLLKTKSSPIDSYHEYFTSLGDATPASPSSPGTPPTSSPTQKHYHHHHHHIFHPRSHSRSRTSSVATPTTYSPTFIPVLHHHFPQHALSSLSNLLTNNSFTPSSQTTPSYGGLIFTSQRAVEAFSSVIEDLKSQGQPLETLIPADFPVYVVGKATADALEGLNLRWRIKGRETGNGENLARFILEDYNDLFPSPNTSQTHESNTNSTTTTIVENPEPEQTPDIPPTPKPPLLFLVGETRRDIIPRTLQNPTLAHRTIQVDEMVIYETGVMESFAVEFCREVRRLLERERRFWVCVFSPTGCRDMLEGLGLLDRESGRVFAGEDATAVKDGKDISRQDVERRKKVDAVREYAKIATIGPTTQEYLMKEFGVEPDVCAATPSPEGIGEGIRAADRRYLEAK